MHTHNYAKQLESECPFIQNYTLLSVLIDNSQPSDVCSNKRVDGRQKQARWHLPAVSVLAAAKLANYRLCFSFILKLADCCLHWFLEVCGVLSAETYHGRWSCQVPRSGMVRHWGTTAADASQSKTSKPATPALAETLRLLQTYCAHPWPQARHNLITVLAIFLEG